VKRRPADARASTISCVADDEQLTIDELARRIGMTVRNIRAHQSRGLLPAPEVRGRTGYYGSDHVARLELIQELQADGFNLDLIRRLLDSASGSSQEVLRFKHALARPFGDEEPRPVNLLELAEEWGTTDLTLLDRAVKVGLVRRRDDGIFELTSPRLVQHGRELAKLGIGLEQQLEIIGRVREQADKIAEAYVEIFLDAVWRPFEQAGQPGERWPDVHDALERLHPLATESVVAIFGLAMGEATEREFGRQVERIAKEREAMEREAGGGADGSAGAELAADAEGAAGVEPPPNIASGAAPSANAEAPRGAEPAHDAEPARDAEAPRGAEPAARGATRQTT
jgi:DNA-binding transcriptional MerR regulator